MRTRSILPAVKVALPAAFGGKSEFSGCCPSCGFRGKAAKTPENDKGKKPVTKSPDILQMTLWNYTECRWCKNPLPLSSSLQRKTCSKSCRSKLSRAEIKARANQKPKPNTENE